jgi:hypothetical protein
MIISSANRTFLLNIARWQLYTILGLLSYSAISYQFFRIFKYTGCDMTGFIARTILWTSI